MPTFPFFRYPYYNGYYRYNNSSNFITNRMNNNYNYSESSFHRNYNYSNEEKNNIKEDVSSIDSSNNETRNDETTDQIFEIFGIKLHFDDILIICLLVLLYNEGVKDYSLFISLILLLIS